MRAAVNREPGMGKDRTAPRRCRVALGALPGKSRSNVIRVRHAVVLTRMAGIAVGRGAIIDTVDVTVRTLNTGMSAGQRELCRAVVKSSRAPCCRVVADGALLRES